METALAIGSLGIESYASKGFQLLTSDIYKPNFLLTSGNFSFSVVQAHLLGAENGLLFHLHEDVGHFLFFSFSLFCFIFFSWILGEFSAISLEASHSMQIASLLTANLLYHVYQYI